jgi:hypothetical protein
MQRENEAGGSRQRRSREEVRRLVDEFEASGSGRAEFCRSRGLALGTLQRHLRARRSATKAASGRSRLVAVSVTPRLEAVSKPAETNLEVVLARGRRIGVRPGFDPGTLRELILALEQA